MSPLADIRWEPVSLPAGIHKETNEYWRYVVNIERPKFLPSIQHGSAKSVIKLALDSLFFSFLLLKTSFSVVFANFLFRCQPAEGIVCFPAATPLCLSHNLLNDHQGYIRRQLATCSTMSTRNIRRINSSVCMTQRFWSSTECFHPCCSWQLAALAEMSSRGFVTHFRCSPPAAKDLSSTATLFWRPRHMFPTRVRDPFQKSFLGCRQLKAARLQELHWLQQINI